jgi:hypothetical protein
MAVPLLFEKHAVAFTYFISTWLSRGKHIMTESTFKKVDRSEKPLYGARKLILCGFSIQNQPLIMEVLKRAGLDDVPTVWATGTDESLYLSELMAMDDKTGWGMDSQISRAVIMGGITQNELHRLMGVYRQSGMKLPLWAVLTPTSEKWPLKSLLSELAAERLEMQKRAARKSD